jgi:peptide/nickel transport system substrate-binding protein
VGRAGALAAAIAVALLAVSGGGVAATQQTPEFGGTISVAEAFEPACLNPLLATCADSSPSVEKALLPAFDVDRRFRYWPRLVSGVTVSTEPPVTLTYHIRPQARWSDGVPVTAADFVFTHAARLALATSLPQSEKAQLEHVRRVTAVGAKTVRVTLREPFSGWQALFPNVLPRHVLQGEDLSRIWVDRVDDPKTGKPIGDGPFLVEGLERSKALTLIRNPQYWGPHLARVDRLVLRFVDDAVDSLRKGDVDIALLMPAPLAASFRDDPDFRVVSPPAAGYEHLAMRLGPAGHAALRNPLVRRALAYGVDRAAIVRAVAGPKKPQQSVVYTVQSPYQRANWQRYERRPALARGLLARAGCKRGADGIYSCAGRRLSLRFVTSPIIPNRPVVLKTVQAQLRKVGVEVVPTYVSPKAFFESVLPRGLFDVALFGWVFDPNPTAAASIYSCGGADNYTGYCSRSVSGAFAQASRMLDPAAQARILNAADRMIAQDAPVLPLYQANPSGVARTSVKGFVRLPYNPYSDAENWWLDR